MDFEASALERLQSIWEHNVGWNLAESGVQPRRVEELVDTEGDRQALLSLPPNLQTNYLTLRRWIERRAARLIHIPPEAGAIALRIGFGCGPELLVPALERIGEVLDSVDASATRPAHAR